MSTLRHLLRAGAVVTFVVIIAAPPSTPQATRQIELSPDSPLTLWYRQPANEWVEALPIGNGRLAGHENREPCGGADV